MYLMYGKTKNCQNHILLHIILTQSYNMARLLIKFMGNLYILQNEHGNTRASNLTVTCRKIESKTMAKTNACKQNGYNTEMQKHCRLEFDNITIGIIHTE